MEITRIYHSGFLLEFEHCVWLIDYYRGEIPDFDREKKLFVFSSHVHHDHFNPEVFDRYCDYPQVEYILSKDISLKPNFRKKYGMDEEQFSRTTPVKADEEYSFDDGWGETICLKTLKSTDAGVAFILEYQGKRIYHAGDLHWWHWEGEDKQWNNNMAASFKREMEKLRGLHLDVAFVPLDPRLEDAYWWGLDFLMKTAEVDLVYPMHYSDEPEVIDRFRQDPVSETYRHKIVHRT
ncbi:MAG: MBL fold metallo-hydrolase [Lachnospiraceae bacterium]|nr:MBL fold metallo-hydrolase [Lachnospiraceae bacterium]